MKEPRVSKSFFKLTRKKKIIHLTHDKYLRNDIECGYLQGRQVSTAALLTLLRDSQHHQLLIVDTNVIVQQIDLFEHNCPATTLVVLTQTVMESIKQTNVSVYRRASALLAAESKSFIFFPNELHSLTATFRYASLHIQFFSFMFSFCHAFMFSCFHRSAHETADDFARRSIQQAALLYADLLRNNNSGCGEVILLVSGVITQVTFKAWTHHT